jgi:hypothetical protein
MQASDEPGRWTWRYVDEAERLYECTIVAMDVTAQPTWRRWSQRIVRIRRIRGAKRIEIGSVTFGGGVRPSADRTFEVVKPALGEMRLTSVDADGRATWETG